MPKLRLRPSPQPNTNDNVNLHQPPRLQRLSELPSKKRRTRLLFSTKTILAMMFTLSMLTLMSSSRIHSRLIRTSKDYDGIWGWKPVYLRNQQKLPSSHGKYSSGRYHPPRVVDLELLPMIEIATKRSMGSRIRRWFRGRTVNDEMLHHDGWKEWEDGGEEEDETSSGWWFSWSNFFWKGSESRQEGQEEEEKERHCVPMMEWQTTSYPNCNVVHEIDMVLSSSQSATFSSRDHRRHITSFPTRKLAKFRGPKAKGRVKEETLTFLGQGWFRSAWKMDQSLTGKWDEEEEEWVFEESVVLKTLRIEREFLDEYYELHRRDALAMERLTFSPYVLDIHGYCGQSAINELANFGIEGLASLEKIARQFRGVSVEPVNKIKLQLASMVAAGVSHMHSIDYPDHIPSERGMKEVGPPIRSNATLVHYDLNPRNVAIVKRGKPKLNDFNVAEFLSWDTERNATCGFRGRFREPWWRAPEEMHYHDSSYKNPAPLTEKVDIYSLGNILHTILTSHSPRGKMSKELMVEVRPKVARGELPKLPSDFNETEASSDPALSPIMSAMYKCLKAFPEDRPSAGEIAEELAIAVDNLPDDYGDKEKFYNSMEREQMKEKLKKKSKSSKQKS